MRKRRGVKGRLSVLLMLLALVLAFRGTVHAGDTSEEDADESGVREELIEEFDFSEINEALASLFPEERMDFSAVLTRIIDGELELNGETVGELLQSVLFPVLKDSKKHLIQILLVAIFAALLQNFSGIFENRQVTQTGYLIIFLLLAALCLRTVQTVMDAVSGGVKKLTVFMTAFCPTYYLAIAVAKGSASAAAFYHLLLLLIWVVEMLVQNVALPAIHIYMVLRMLDHISEEAWLGKFAKLLEMAVTWGLKALFALVIGIHLVQGMISPAIDTVKQSVLSKGVEAIPGVGDLAGGVTEVFLATAVLVKNGVGVAGMLFCMALVLSPLIQVGVLALLYKLAAALIQPVSDKRVIGCVESVGDGCILLLRVVATVGVLFLLTIAVAARVTGLD